jgi:PAS domain-containing protein
MTFGTTEWTSELQRIIGTDMDVMEHELLTQELRRREASLAEAQRLRHTGSFGWKVSSGELFWSDETFRIFQCDATTKPTLEFVISRVHPEDRDLMQQRIDLASQGAQRIDFEHRLQLPDGRIKHVRVSARMSRDSSGDLEFAGAVTDVSEQRQTKALIRDRERELQQILDLTPQQIGVLKGDGTPFYANRVALEYLGLDIERWQDKASRLGFIHPDDHERFLGERKARSLEGAPMSSRIDC